MIAANKCRDDYCVSSPVLMTISKYMCIYYFCGVIVKCLCVNALARAAPVVDGKSVYADVHTSTRAPNRNLIYTTGRTHGANGSVNRENISSSWKP